MSITLLDIMLPIGLAAVFAVFRYTQHMKTDPKTARARALSDGISGAIGLAVITIGYKFISQS